jgi:4-alpha-glucanotransferase
MQPESFPRLAGVLVPAFSLRTADDLGIGDTAGVRAAIDWCARHRIGLLQLLPINETSADNSPYNAISSMAIDPLSLDLSPSVVPGLARTTFQRLCTNHHLERMRRRPAIDYPGVRALKHAILSDAFKTFENRDIARDSALAVGFRNFCAEHAAWLPDYALFRALMGHHGGSPAWEFWPEFHRSPAAVRAWLLTQPAGERNDLQRAATFHAWVQWLAYTQWEQLKAHADSRGVRLMGDIPFGVGRCSADVWANRELFDLDWSGGAPPEKVFKVDPFTEKWGQNWGIPIYRWDMHRATNHAWWRARVANLCRAFHYFRIDHVLGLYRIYSFPWQPSENDAFLPLDETAAAARTGGRLPRFKAFADDTPEHQAANRAQGEELLRMIQDAAGASHVIAEDLGVVPEYVPASLASLGIPGFRIPAFWRHPDGTYDAPWSYPELSVASPATHDFPPLALEWRRLRETAAGSGPEAAAAQRELEAQARYAGLEAPPADFSPALHAGWMRAILSCSSRFAIVQITDLFADTARFNTPGAVSADNWAWRLPVPIAELDENPRYAPLTRQFAELALAHQRAPAPM